MVLFAVMGSALLSGMWSAAKAIDGNRKIANASTLAADIAEKILEDRRNANLGFSHIISTNYPNTNQAGTKWTDCVSAGLYCGIVLTSLTQNVAPCPNTSTSCTQVAVEVRASSGGTLMAKLTFLLVDAPT